MTKDTLQRLKRLRDSTTPEETTVLNTLTESCDLIEKLNTCLEKAKANAILKRKLENKVEITTEDKYCPKCDVDHRPGTRCVAKVKEEQMIDVSVRYMIEKPDGTLDVKGLSIVLEQLFQRLDSKKL